MKPCCWSGNSSEPTLSLPNFQAISLTYSPPFLVPGWSLAHEQKQAGHLTDCTSGTYLPPQKFSTLREGCTAAIARMLLQSADILKAIHAPQQYPAARMVSEPSPFMQVISFQYLSLSAGIFCCCTTFRISGTFSIGPLQTGSKNSGTQTLKPRLAQVSAILKCFPLSIPKMSQNKTSALLPDPLSQIFSPLTSTVLPLGAQLTCRAGQEPGGQQPCSDEDVQQPINQPIKYNSPTKDIPIKDLKLYSHPHNKPPQKHGYIRIRLTPSLSDCLLFSFEVNIDNISIIHNNQN